MSKIPKEFQMKSFDRALLSITEGLRTNGTLLIPFVVSLSNHDRNQLVHRLPQLAHKQQGFTIVMAIFILVVLGLLGGYMVRLSGVQHATSTYALQGARAYQAASAGLGWATAKISTGGGCVDVNAQTALTLPELSGFTVKLTCALASYQEGSDTPGIFLINAHSEFGAYGGVDYVSRELEVSIVN